MKTFKPIATITYVDNDYLISQLNALVNTGDIEFWAFINHKREDITLKDHTHLFIQPIAKLETRDLQFTQNELKGTMPYKKSDFGNWFFYCSHNKLYLSSKKLEKKYTYSIGDFVASDYNSFVAMVQTLEIEEFLNDCDSILLKIKKSVKAKIPFSNLVYNGWIPINQIRNYQKAYDDIWRETERLARLRENGELSDNEEIPFQDLFSEIKDIDPLTISKEEENEILKSINDLLGGLSNE